MQADYVFALLSFSSVIIALLFAVGPMLLHLFICNRKIGSRGGRLSSEEFWGSKEITLPYKVISRECEECETCEVTYTPNKTLS